MNAPRIEAPATNAANWTGTIAYNGGAAVGFTVTPGTRYPAALLAALAATLTTAAGAAITVSASSGGRGTGKVTISGAASFAIVWTSTVLRDVCGFGANLSGASSYTSPAGMLGMWIPGCSVVGPDLDPVSEGALRREQMQVANKAGHLFDWPGSSHRSFRDVRFDMVEQARAVEGADDAYHAWEAFIRLCQTGEHDAFPLSDAYQVPAVKVYFDADADEVLGADVGGDGVYRMRLDSDAAMPMLTEGFVLFRTVLISELFKVPA